MLVIRPEARAVSWDALNKGQQDALIRILKMIECSLPKKPPKPSGTHQRQIPYISDDRSSRLAFLDGDRGTGKSTVLTSLQKIIKEGKIESSSNQPEIDCDTINSIRDNVIWLETIDMDPTPPNWNMLPAILSRFEQAYNQHCSRQTGEDGNYQNSYTGLLEPSHNHHETMRELLQLQNNIALSWNGNLHDRSSNLDPDAYALETMRVEQARLGLNPSVERVLDSMAYEISRVNPRVNALFILPIDDFDMNPIVCLELLRILRMLSVPRLFTLMLGDLEIVDIVLNLKLSNDLNSVCPNIRKEMLSIESRDVAMAAGRIAANAIHKLLPPMQCIQLRLMTVHEGLNFYPLGDYSKNDKYRLYQKLQQCELNFFKPLNDEKQHNNDQTGNTFPYEIPSLFKFLLLKGLPVIDKQTNPKKEKFGPEDFCTPKQTDKDDNDSFEREDLRESFYSGIQILETVPRYATDIWFAINRFIELIDHSKIDKNKKWIKLLELVAELCRTVLLRDRTLDPESRRLTRGSFFNNYLDGWDFESIPIKISSVLDNGRIISSKIHADIDKDNKKLMCKFNAFKALKWQFRLATNIEEDSKIPDAYGIEYKHIGKDFFSAHHLENDTTGAMIFFHDLLVLGPTFRSHSFLLTPGIEHVKENAWCTTTWQDGLAYQVELPWYRPRCLSFWGLDLFLFAWNHAIDELKEDELKEPELSLDTLAFAWISAGTGVISNRTPVSSKVKNKWEVLGKELAKMAKDHQSKPLSEQFNSWLISVALMIMPETGLTEIEGISKIYNSKELRTFWSTYRRIICNYRYDRLKKIYDANMQKLSGKLYAEEPSGFKESISNKKLPFDEFCPPKFKDLINKGDKNSKTTDISSTS